MLKLPSNIFQHCCVYLKPPDLFSSKSVCKHFHNELKSDALWKQVIKVHHPELQIASNSEKAMIDILNPTKLKLPENLQCVILFSRNGQTFHRMEWRSKEKAPNEKIPYSKIKLAEIPMRQDGQWPDPDFDVILYMVLQEGKATHYRHFKFNLTGCSPINIFNTSDGIKFGVWYPWCHNQIPLSVTLEDCKDYTQFQLRITCEEETINFDKIASDEDSLQKIVRKVFY